MKKYYLLVSVFFCLVLVIIITRKPAVPAPKMSDQLNSISNNSEWLNTKQAIETLEYDLKVNPFHTATKIKLIQAYIQQARVTGNHQYYDALAYQLVNQLLKVEPGNFEALSCKATLQATAHQFDDALITCNQALHINPHHAYIHGVLCDANVELGNYIDAEKAANKMVAIRPDIRSYSRISYLREIYGDYEGAKQAMTLALHSGMPGLEQTEWVRVYLGRLYEITGKPAIAKQLYGEAILHRENYAPALAALGHIAKSENRYRDAIDFYKLAIAAQNDYAYHQELGELYAGVNNQSASIREFDIARKMLVMHQHPTNEENGIGHNIDRELAQLYLTMQQNDLAYNSALIEYKRRPKNIDVNETLAWASFRLNKFQEAQYYILKALSTQSKNAELLYKAGLILQKNNHPHLASDFIKNAMSINPIIANKFNGLTPKSIALLN